MDIKLLILTTFFLSTCQEKNIGYDEAMKNCDNNFKTLEVTDPITNESRKVKLINEDCIIGYQLPTFEATTIEGKTISDQNLLGKINIINFWFQTCAPCVAEIPGLNQLKEKYSSENINFIAIGTDNKRDIKTFMEEHPFNFEHIADGDELYRSVFKSKWGFPFTIVTDKNNVILQTISGGTTDTSAVQNIINKIEPFIKSEL